MSDSVSSTSEPIVHKNLAILRVEKPHVFEEIRALVDIDDFIIGQLSPTEVAIDPKRVRELDEALNAKGLHPLLRRA